MSARLPPGLDRTLSLARADFAPSGRAPAAGRLIAVVAVSVAGSLAADTLLVAIGTALSPSAKGYAHFQFQDYAKLTVVGVVIACLAWPVVTRISSAPRWLFFRLVVLVALVLWLPDLYILDLGQPGRAVAVLMVMPLAVALVTCNSLVHITEMRPASRPASHARVPASHARVPASYARVPASRARVPAGAGRRW